MNAHSKTIFKDLTKIMTHLLSMTMSQTVYYTNIDEIEMPLKYL